MIFLPDPPFVLGWDVSGEVEAVGFGVTLLKPEEAGRRGVRTELMLVEADHAGMTAVAGLITRGQLRAHIAATFPLADAAKAHELGETNRTAGKLVLTMD